MNRSQLKGLIKECLIEILDEGLGGVMLERKKRPLIKKRTRVLNKHFSKAVTAARELEEVPEGLMTAATSLAQGDTIMESIFADTIASTIPTQANSPRGASPEAQAIANIAPDEIFEGAEAWEAMAFADHNPTPHTRPVAKTFDHKLDTPLAQKSKARPRRDIEPDYDPYAPVDSEIVRQTD